MMIHNPFTMAMGDTEEMRKAIQLLDEVKESIINAYQIKTGLDRATLSQLMDSETWMNAKKAKELGFCDEILYTSDNELPDNNASGFSYGRKAAAACLMNRVIATLSKPEPTPEPVTPEPVTPDNRVKAADLEKRLSLLK
jgi:ATP-dependent Clp protease protease subunit